MMTEAEIVYQATVYRLVARLLRYPAAEAGVGVAGAGAGTGEGGLAEADAGASERAAESGVASTGAEAGVAAAGAGAGANAAAAELAATARELAALFTSDAEEHALACLMAESAEREGAGQLAIDYTALFIGAFEMLAPPYASYYLDGQRQLGGASTVEVERAYADFGLVLSQARKQPGDNLATMCEFLFAVLRDAALAGEDAQRREHLVALSHGFFLRYVRPWVCDLSALIIRHARTNFYHELGKLLPLVLVEDSLFEEQINR